MIRIHSFVYFIFLLAACSTSSGGLAAIQFNFENTPATSNGSLTYLTLTQNGLMIAIDRSGQPFDIANESSLANSARSGSRSLSPTPPGANPFNVNFSKPVSSFGLDFFDSTGESADHLKLSAYSGPNGTGKYLGSVAAIMPLNPGGAAVFKTLELTGRGIESVRFAGGTLRAPNSVFYDNFTVGRDSTTAVPLPAGVYPMSLCAVMALLAMTKLQKVADR